MRVSGSGALVSRVAIKMPLKPPQKAQTEVHTFDAIGVLKCRTCARYKKYSLKVASIPVTMPTKPAVAETRLQNIPKKNTMKKGAIDSAPVQRVLLITRDA